MPQYPENTWNIQSYVVDEYTMMQNKVWGEPAPVVRPVPTNEGAPCPARP